MMEDIAAAVPNVKSSTAETSRLVRVFLLVVPAELFPATLLKTLGSLAHHLSPATSTLAGMGLPSPLRPTSSSNPSSSSPSTRPSSPKKIR